MNRNLAVSLALVGAGLAIAEPAVAFPISGNLYVQPSSEPFIENAGETVITVNDSSGSIATAQNALNNAHTNNPGAIVVLNLTGTYQVSSAALNLTSNTCCALTSGTVIEAASSSITATCLIQIHGQSNVSVAGGTFNGDGASVNAIQVETSSRVNIDDVTVENCDRDGIYLTGNGNSTFDSENTITRCSVSGGTSNGIKVESCTQAVIIDNNCSSNSGAGIYLSGAHTTVTNNTCTSNGTGISVAGPSNFISDNECDSNPTGIDLISGSGANVIASNHAYYATTVGINETASASDTFFENYYKGNTINFTSSGSGNHHLAYKAAISDPNDDYFYPPILSNQHTTTTIVNGLGRYDLTIGSATIASVQSQYNSARSSHSSDVIVVHLTGTYNVAGSPLTLSSNTCVLLSGTIQASSSTTAASCVNCASGAVHVSFSGGTVDGGSNTALEAIVFSGAGMGWIQGVTIRNFGQTETNSGMIVLTQSTGPLMASSNTVTTVSGRGVWTQGNGPFVITDNTVSGGEADGVDCDYHTAMALVKLNTLSGNFRYGVFFEQGAQYNVGIGNTCSSGLTRGFNIYDNAEEQVTEYNIAACNVCNGNFNGLKSGASGNGANGQPSTCSHNFFFNNTAQENTGDGIDSEQDGTENYYSQTILGGNGTDIVRNGAEVFFNSTEP